uniref:hypothetical protein n=1 Tax=Yersinia frederiksenii TaxID=29484 RepID=UPI001F4BCF0F|nr:hypothetical protein [Yersinia frederiksenii]
MVRQVLKDVSRLNKFHYQSVLKEFVDGNNPSCTQCFWETFYRLFPDSPYHYVAYCHDCRQFDLYETEATMRADDPLFW